ncbi:MAG: CDP-alcohol phosphatidyltransferase family protein [Nannocystis sp.]|nr:CDP-alcohol phosphatidyltransferase family protein [Nannocystis sp.]MBA3546050.1 CDP-alcohol phosphatidyltransferase family protein [Nannocystis sp.]
MAASFSDIADRLPSATAFVEVGPEGGHALQVGGLSVLERVLWGLSRSGIGLAMVAAEPLPLRPDRPLQVVWVAPGGAAPADMQVVRGDEVQGTRVVDEATRRAAERGLCRTLAKSHQGLIDGWVNWRFSSPITRLLSYTPVRPNHITLAASVVGLASAAIVLRGGWAAIATAGVLLQLHSILDSCDGEMARLRFQGSRLGQWLDNVCDDVIDMVFLICAGLTLGGGYATLAVVATLVRAWGHLVMYHEVYSRTGTGDVYSFRIWFQRESQAVDEVYGVRGFGGYFRALGRRDTYVFVWMLLCLLGQLEVVVVYGAVLGVMIGALMALHVLLRPRLPARRA